ncbi:MAG: hypothetical protein B7C24_10090 [Bacteroidetes bacterium 4572_77]|nr:MAG: hypothetical protein B7C24_10090 [Bacteroidetes bacterium 4572_77]
MKPDLTNFYAMSTTVALFLSVDKQFVEDITSMLASITTVEADLMVYYEDGSTADRNLIDKLLDTTENWRGSLRELKLTAPTKIIQSDFSLTEGIDLSIDQPYLTYTSVDDELLIETAPYSNNILINTIPSMSWEDGGTVYLINDWYGVGTKRARCKIDTTNHSDEQIKGSVDFVRSSILEPVTTTTKFNISMTTYEVNKPYVTFDSLTNKLTLNMNVMKDTPHINQIPKLTWIGDTTVDTEVAAVESDWIGLGTYSAYCIVDVPDSAGPITDLLEGTIILTYEPGSSEAWSLRYDWNNYNTLSKAIEVIFDQDIPLTVGNYTTYVKNMNEVLSDTIALEAALEKDYVIATANDLPIIDHVLITLRNWKITIRDSISNLNDIFPTIKT